MFENVICNGPNNEVKCHGATSVVFQSSQVHHIGVREQRLSVKFLTGFSVNCVWVQISSNFQQTHWISIRESYGAECDKKNNMKIFLGLSAFIIYIDLFPHLCFCFFTMGEVSKTFTTAAEKEYRHVTSTAKCPSFSSCTSSFGFGSQRYWYYKWIPLSELCHQGLHPNCGLGTRRVFLLLRVAFWKSWLPSTLRG